MHPHTHTVSHPPHTQSPTHTHTMHRSTHPHTCIHTHTHETVTHHTHNHQHTHTVSHPPHTQSPTHTHSQSPTTHTITNTHTHNAQVYTSTHMHPHTHTRDSHPPHTQITPPPTHTHNAQVYTSTHMHPHTHTHTHIGSQPSYPDSQCASQLIHLVIGQSLDLLMLLVEVTLKRFIVNVRVVNGWQRVNNLKKESDNTDNSILPFFSLLTAPSLCIWVKLKGEAIFFFSQLFFSRQPTTMDEGIVMVKLR